MRIKAIHTVNGGDIYIECDTGTIAVKRHSDSYSSARRVAVIPDDMRHTVTLDDVPKRRKSEGYAGSIAF